jgi:hypothetical protein
MHSVLIGSVPVLGFAVQELPGLSHIYSVACCGRSIDAPSNASRWV